MAHAEITAAMLKLEMEAEDARVAFLANDEEHLERHLSEVVFASATALHVLRKERKENSHVR